MTNTYPLNGSLGDRIYELTEAELDQVLVRARGEGKPRHRSSPRLSTLRSERTFGWSFWKHPDRELLIQTQIPPHRSTPVGVMLTFWVEENENYFLQLKEFGFPVPESDPAFIVGQRDEQKGKTTGWIPGPGGLASLLYTSQGNNAPFRIAVYSELPMEAERESEDSAAAAFDWKGTLRFDSWEGVEDGEVNEHIRPGSIRARFIL